jgi:hypothetical protein
MIVVRRVSAVSFYSILMDGTADVGNELVEILYSLMMRN